MSSVNPYITNYAGGSKIQLFLHYFMAIFNGLSKNGTIGGLRL
jgi:hypothetical protein